jgi:hypothetical protein
MKTKSNSTRLKLTEKKEKKKEEKTKKRKKKKKNQKHQMTAINAIYKTEVGQRTTRVLVPL